MVIPAAEAEFEHYAWVKESIRPLALADLPAVPDRARLPLLGAHWEQMLHKAELRDPAWAFDPPLFARTWLVSRNRKPGDDSIVPSPRVEGDNWCGAVLQPRDGMRFTEVVGRWRIPAWSPCTQPPPAGQVRPRASAWVGLDGARLSSQAMPQVGVVFGPPGSADPGDPSDVSLWFEWWLRDKWSPPLRLDGIPAKPGDLIACGLRVVAADRVQAFVKNEASNLLVALEAKAPAGYLVAGKTAEWIVERPLDPLAADPNHQLYALPDFTALTFEGCVAGLARQPGPSECELPLRNACLVRMTERLTAPRRTAVIAKPDPWHDAGRLRISRLADG